jgi:hypothetical protein
MGQLCEFLLERPLYAPPSELSSLISFPRISLPTPTINPARLQAKGRLQKRAEIVVQTDLFENLVKFCDFVFFKLQGFEEHSVHRHFFFE